MDLFGIEETSKKSLKLNRAGKASWIEDSLLGPDIDDDQAEKFSRTDGYLQSIFSEKRLKLFMWAVVLGLTTLMGRAGYLQIIQAEVYQAQAKGNRLRTEYVRSDRGLIYDRFQIPLVRNVPNYTLSIVPSQLPESDEKRFALLKEIYRDVPSISKVQSEDQLIQKFEEARNDRRKTNIPIQIASHLKQDNAILLQILADTEPAIRIDKLTRREYLNEGPPTVERNDTRVYPSVKSLSHLLGYVTNLREGEYDEVKENGYLFNDVIGRIGIESAYEETLRGEFGNRQIEVDVYGNVKQVVAKTDPNDGLNLITSLDLELQRATEDIMRRELENVVDVNSELKRASGVILDPNNGEVLSMVSLPSFDNNLFAKTITTDQYKALIENEHQPLFNRAISGEYPSGSTFKPIVAAAALQEGIISPRTSYISNGGIRINRWFFPDWKAGGHGITNVYYALSDSVNTYFYIIGGGYAEFDGLGVANISDYAREFGLSNKLGLDLPGEKAGFLPSKEWKESYKKERWYIGDTYHLAIGQGDLLVTPLQAAAWTATFANGGTLYKPHLAKALIDQDFNVVEDFEPEILNQDFIQNNHMETIQIGLRRVVTEGSGRRLGDLPMTVSGKTGTAQWHSKKDPHAWFIGYAPAENPEIAFAFMVEEGKEGSGVTVSITKEVLRWWYENRMSIE